MSKMKQAILSYESMDDGKLFNVGDHIQSIAAAQFSDKNKGLIYLNREALNQYQGEKARLILNGWFMHHPANWPPSEGIEPLFVSFHINSAVREQFAKPENIAYFKVHQPIGCRDQSSVDFLQSQGVEAYLSRCLTLTLGRTYRNERKDGPVVIVDPLVDHYVSSRPRAKDLLPYFVTLITKRRLLNSLRRKLHNDVDPGRLKSWANAIRYYRTFRSALSDEVMLGATYVSHIFQRAQYMTEDARFAKAKELLEIYSKARYVITSRIHCALPCLAMDTPVAYVVNTDENNLSHCRFDGITELFRCIKIGSIDAHIIHSEFKEELTLCTQFTNTGSHQQYADIMSEKCLEFCRQ